MSLSPREKRLLKELSLHERVSVRDLRSTIGALNPCQIALQLRRKGWKIDTGYMTVVDRDGKECRPGYYEMCFDERNRARDYLARADGAAATAQTGQISEQQHSKDDLDQNSKGGKI